MKQPELLQDYKKSGVGKSPQPEAFVQGERLSLLGHLGRDAGAPTAVYLCFPDPIVQRLPLVDLLIAAADLSMKSDSASINRKYAEPTASHV